MTKKEALERWANLDPDQPVMRHFLPIPYKAKGSTYGACGIRIDGTPQFIDAVLSHLKELLDGENVYTRLSLARNRVENRLEGHDFRNRESDAECCYVRLHQRGRESMIAHTIDEALKENRQ